MEHGGQIDRQDRVPFVTPEEVASLVLYLSGELAQSVTGANLSMDGGWTAA